jgi:hypothetical protein
MMINIDQDLLGRQSNTITRLLLHFTLNNSLCWKIIIGLVMHKI